MDIPVFSFNDVVLLLGGAQSLLLSFIILFVSSIESTQRWLLSVFLVALGLDFFDTLFYWAVRFRETFLLGNDTLLFLLKPLVLLVPPTLYLYLRAAFLDDFRWSSGKAWHLLPVVIAGLLVVACLTRTEASVLALAHVDFEYLFHSSWFQLYLLLKGAVFCVYGGLCVRMLAEIRQRLEQNYSAEHRVDPRWLRLLVVGVFSVWGLYFAAHLMHLLAENTAAAGAIGMIGNYFNVLFTTSLVVYCISAPQSIRGRANPTDYVVHGGSRLSPVIETVQQQMATKRLYLDPDLTLEQLAGSVAVPPRLLSEAINRVLGKNFFEFINGYRVRYARELLEQHGEELSILEILTRAGFNSKSTFNRCFKREQGVAPREYRRRLTKTVSAAAH